MSDDATKLKYAERTTPDQRPRSASFKLDTDDRRNLRSLERLIMIALCVLLVGAGFLYWLTFLKS